MKRILIFALILWATMTATAMAEPEKFCIAKDGKTATIVVDEQDWKGVIRAANDLGDDVRKVCGTASEVIVHTSSILPHTSSIMVGTIGIAGIGTLLSTITANTRGKDVLLAILFIPLVFPLLYSCVSATTVVVAGGDIEGVYMSSVLLAAGYDLIMVLLSWVLYDFAVSA